MRPRRRGALAAPALPRTAGRASRRSPGAQRPASAGAGRLARGPRRARVPCAPGRRPPVARWRDERDGDADPARRPAVGGRGDLPGRHPDGDLDPPDRRGDDREGAPHARRRPRHRVRAHALSGPRAPARASHRLHLEPGGLRRRLSVLCHRRARLLARPVDRRDRRPGPVLGAAAAGRWTAGQQRRLHGHG